MKKIKIAIADDNRELVGLMEDYLNAQANMEVVKVAYNGKTCIEMLRNHTIDILLLDIIMPYLDGIAVLDAIKENEDLQGIDVIMLSAFGQESIMSQAAEYGASYFIMKPFEVERLAVQINHIMNARTGRSKQTEDKRTKDDLITNMVKDIGIPPHLKGYLYLKEAVSLVLEQPEILNKVTKVLYPGIATKFDTTSSRVERSIRHAIEQVWNRHETVDHISKIFGYSVAHLESKPTNSEFIAMVADSLQLKMRDDL
ncbi:MULTISPECIES: sporulation transcription factor Spo0A [Planococcus]|uniref:Stage 0 sporulation protein A homolog n=1 Tax=Planococcus faecalis TaxID=1598147 RepID=A0ABM6IRH5_9BACL|nr:MULTISPECIES: sporulation transcription factor Spo0A [Planococcus]AQU79208.1 sporulation transcription factor Spo0A [Planococcus faecalis]MDJ0332316.1 sporulation transcription factor Spo0A [Planococcus sp. S3-L1]OHX52258.1 sporulation transcription factor Spo0A [Planococcus faecalis]